MKNKLTIATDRDYVRIAEIWNQNKKELTDDARKVSPAELKDFLRHGYRFYTFSDDAFACIKRERGTMILAHFAVEKNHRERGTGSALSIAIEKLAKHERCGKIRATTRADNAHSQVLLLKRGFRPIRINYHQFADGTDEIEYEKSFKA